MTVTRKQYKALKTALWYMAADEKQIAQQLNEAGWKPEDSIQYKDLVAAMQTIEEMLRGVQGEMEL